MKPLFVHYPKCGTCQKAAKWLKIHCIEVLARDIVTDKPTETELDKWISLSGLPVHKFFNTSGLVYKAQGLKDKVKIMSQAEQIARLASDGKLVKRPVLVLPDRVLVGFKEEEWEQVFAPKR